uniref:valine--tRNA ligase n=1 Tax=Lactuca sativa TaxID=4236 RepID=A0A9R1XDH0_LACSA|nr:hypothetical protein LSAT_V11C400204800 [Lactuca sativa]
MPRFEARVAITEALKSKVFNTFLNFLSNLKRHESPSYLLHQICIQGLYKGEEKNEMRLGVCSRSNDVIEHMIKPQWYVNCNCIAKEALDAVMDENNKKIDILPKHYDAEWKKSPTLMKLRGDVPFQKVS